MPLALRKNLRIEFKEALKKAGIPQGCLGTYPAAFLCHPSSGTRDQLEADPSNTWVIIPQPPPRFIPILTQRAQDSAVQTIMIRLMADL